MNRRNFLAMAFGAALAIPAITQTMKADGRAARIKVIEQHQRTLATAYINATVEEREYVIERLNEMASKPRNAKIKKLVEDYRDILLSYDVVPAVEVER